MERRERERVRKRRVMERSFREREREVRKRRVMERSWRGRERLGGAEKRALLGRAELARANGTTEP